MGCIFQFTSHWVLPVGSLMATGKAGNMSFTGIGMIPFWISGPEMVRNENFSMLLMTGQQLFNTLTVNSTPGCHIHGNRWFSVSSPMRS
ncbi:hypothetical protein FKM82_029162 [Ascaphus truei]